MVGLTYTPPLLPSLAAASIGPQPGAAAALVLQVLSARSVEAAQASLGDALASLAGPGNVVTGRVTTLSADGNVTLTTENGSQVTLHHPPELPLSLGSTVTLRVVLSGPTPQAAVLAVDGKPVLNRAGSGGGQAATAAPSLPATTMLLPRATALPGADSASAYAASLSAVLSLADEAALEGAVGQARVSGNAGDADAPAMATLLDQALALLIRPAPIRAGQAPPPIGTRYVLSLETEALPPAVAEAVAPAVAAAAGASAAPDEDPAFIPQAATLSGRILPPVNEGATLIETPLGTLALAVALPLPPETAVRLTIAAVAPPARSVAIPAAPASGGLIEQILKVLGTASPDVAEQVAGELTLPTDSALLAAAWAFIADPRRRAALRDAAAATRQALLAADRPDLAERLEQATAEMGTSRPPATPDGWSLVTLPFLGHGGEQAIRVYAKRAGDDAEDDGHHPARGDRIVVEVTLTRLGRFQFDGLVRDRRFDLVVRTPGELATDLRALIERAFQGAISECGFAGELLFARTPATPILAPAAAAAGVGISV